MPNQIDDNVNSASDKIDGIKSPIGIVNGITENTNKIESSGDNFLNLVDKGKGVPQAGLDKLTDAKSTITADGKKIIELGKRFANAFGFVGANTGASLQETNITEALTGAKVVVKDGRSSYEEFTLKRPGLELKFGYTGLIKQLDDVFAPPPLVSFKRSKRIDETIVSSNDANGTELEFGQVVENYGRKPIDIDIKGILVDMVNHQYPSDKVKQLVDLFDYNGAWEVEGKIFADHKIKSIYFIDMDDAPIQGYMDTWSFTLNARSIKPVEYFLNKK